MYGAGHATLLLSYYFTTAYHGGLAESPIVPHESPTLTHRDLVLARIRYWAAYWRGLLVEWVRVGDNALNNGAPHIGVINDNTFMKDRLKGQVNNTQQFKKYVTCSNTSIPG